MRDLTNYITTTNWDDIALIMYVCVDDAYQALLAQFGPVRQRGPAPAVSDSEIITGVLLCELFFEGDERRFLSLSGAVHAPFVSTPTAPVAIQPPPAGPNRLD